MKQQQYLRTFAQLPATVVVCFFLLVACDQTDVPKTIDVSIAGHPFVMELVTTPAQIRKGMMGRDHIGESEGMLFVFPDEKVRSFWMKNCLIPLDAVFLDRAGRIVSFKTMPVPSEDEADNPPSHSSRWPAQFVIEMKAGRAEALGLKSGQTIALPLKKLNHWVK